jgi:hypothetical protein
MRRLAAIDPATVFPGAWNVEETGAAARATGTRRSRSMGGIRGPAGILPVLPILLVTGSLAGCGTTIGMGCTPEQVRTIRGTESKVYIGVAFDAHGVVTGPSEILGSGKPALWVLGPPIYLYLIIDFVPSALLDTLLLPVTLSSEPSDVPGDAPKSGGEEDGR